jgi:hypothetical protein
MFCPKCGKQVNESDAFCRSCGHTLSKEKPASAGVALAYDAPSLVGVGKAGKQTKKSSEAATIIRIIVLLFALGFVISKRDWIRNAADDMGGYDAGLKQEEKDAERANVDAILNGNGVTTREEIGKPVNAGNPPMRHNESPSVRRGNTGGKAEVYSWPQMATVWVDGEEVGETPLTVPLDPGSHKIKIAKDGYLPWESQIPIRSGHSEHVEVTLPKEGDKTAEPKVEISEAIQARGDKEKQERGAAEPDEQPGMAAQARGYKDEEGMYRVRRTDDGEAQYQFNAINEDLITLVPECANTDSAFSSPAMKRETEKSLKLDEYQLSILMGHDEATAFHRRMVEKGCF